MFVLDVAMEKITFYYNDMQRTKHSTYQKSSVELERGVFLVTSKGHLRHLPYEEVHIIGPTYSILRSY